MYSDSAMQTIFSFLKLPIYETIFPKLIYEHLINLYLKESFAVKL